jgi:hemerythrin
MSYIFDKTLESGNLIIDTQHHKMIDWLNLHIDDCSTGKARSSLESFVRSVSDYTVKHFPVEEKLQQRYHYPDFITHKCYHDDFKKTIVAIESEISEQGPTVALVGKVNTDIASWLIKHIKTEDSKVAAYVKSLGNLDITLKEANQTEFELYKCPICGNIALKLFDAGAPLSCCGSKMEEMKTTTTDHPP